MKRHVALLDISVFTGLIEIDVVPSIRVVQVVNGGRTQQELDLVARHADLELIHQSRIDAIALGDILSIHATLECYNEGSGNKD